MNELKACSRPLHGLLMVATLLALTHALAAQDWLSWRGPHQNGTSSETGLPDDISLGSVAWTYPKSGRGTPVVSGGRLYGLSYEGAGKELTEACFCLDAATGRLIWEHRYKDFLTDVIYSRYAIGSPTIDPETGDVFVLSTAGLLMRLDKDSGTVQWERALTAEYGRLTFPNGRTGAPLIVGDLCIVHIATSGWGDQTPARDRFYAFEKTTGISAWSSTPGGPPKDLSFSFPVVDVVDGQTLLYAGLAGGHLVCVDAKTGEPQWAFRMATGGISTSPLLHGDSVIAIHGKENMDSSVIGRMISIKRGARPEPGKPRPILDPAQYEEWRNELCSFTSSPVLVGDLVYQTVLTGDLHCVDANTGKSLWHQKLAPDQIHASPAFGDGKLYVPMNDGSFHVLRPTREAANLLQSVQLEGNGLGAPAIAGGRVFVHTTKKLYCFDVREKARAAAPVVRLQVRPYDAVIRQGDSVRVRVLGLDAKGNVVRESMPTPMFEGLPEKGVSLNDAGMMDVASDAAPFAGIVKVRSGDLAGSMRLRIVPRDAYSMDFETVELKPNPDEPGVHSAKPPAYWVGANGRWEVRELDGERVLAKSFDSALFQRTMTFIGDPESRDYTMSVDILTDGNRRSMSVGGVVNQRYLIRLKGNHQTLEVVSNDELLKESVPFKWSPKTWYRLKTRVDVDPATGIGIIRAKVWQRDQAEPSAWTLEVTHPDAHQHGAPGIYGFTPQNRFRVYLDNITVTPNRKD